MTVLDVFLNRRLRRRAEALARRSAPKGSAGSSVEPRQTFLSPITGKGDGVVRGAGAPARSRGTGAKDRLLLEPLEPRILLNADIPGIDLIYVSNPDANQSMLVELVSNPKIEGNPDELVHHLIITDEGTGTTLYNKTLDQVEGVQIDLGGGDDRIVIDTSGLTLSGNVVLPKIYVSGGDDAPSGTGYDQITLLGLEDTTSRWELGVPGTGTVDDFIAFTGMERLAGGLQDDVFHLSKNAGQPGGPVAIDGGGGANTIRSSLASSLGWSVTHPDTGTVFIGAQQIASFESIGTLVGADNSDDTFTLAADGGLSGMIDGGVGGFDSLHVNGTYASATATLAGDRTTLDLDGKTLVYRGLEPILLNDNSLQVVILGTSGDDHVILEDGPYAGTFQVRSLNDSFATSTFDSSVLSVVLGLGLGHDSFETAISDGTFLSANVIIAETGNLTLGNISGIAGSLSASTISVVNHAEAGDLDHDGSTISVRDGSVINISGDLSLSAAANDVLDASSIQEWISAPIIAGAISIGDNVSISARDVSATVTATNERQVFVAIDATSLIRLALADARKALASGWQELTLEQTGDSATFTRAAGNWADDLFEVGQEVLLQDTVIGLNRSFLITGLSGQVMTVALKTGETLPVTTLVETDSTSIGGYSFTRVVGKDLITFGKTADGKTASLEGLNASTDVVFRDGLIELTGADWGSDFTAGQSLRVELKKPDGTLLRTQSFTIMAVGGKRLEVHGDLAALKAALQAGTKVDFNATGETFAIVRGVPIHDPEARHVMATGQSLSFDANCITLNSTNGATWDSQFKTGQTVSLEIARANSPGGQLSLASFTIASVDGNKLYVEENVDELASFAGQFKEVIASKLGSFMDEGFLRDQLITVQGTDRNDNSYRIKDVTDRMLILEPDANIAPQTIDMSDPATTLIIQKVSETIGEDNIGDLPLILLDAKGNTIKGTDGKPLSFTQAELESAYATQNAKLGLSGKSLADEVVSYLADNPILDAITSFGPRIVASQVSASLDVGQGTVILATGNVTLSAETTASADSTAPSVILGVSVAYSKASATVNIHQGVQIVAEGSVEIRASTENAVTASSSVTSGAIVNPAQGAVSGFATDTVNRVFDQVNPAVGIGFSALMGLAPAVTGFVNVPGPSVAIAVGVADTDTDILVSEGSSVLGNTIKVLANMDYDVEEAPDDMLSASAANAYGVSAGNMVFQPGKNQGQGISISVGVSNSDTKIRILGDLETREGTGSYIVIAAGSENEANSVSASSWTRNVKQNPGGAFNLLHNAPGAVAGKANEFLDKFRKEFTFSQQLNENPGEFSLAAALALMFSHNSSQIIIERGEAEGASAPVIRAGGELVVAARSVEHPKVAAAGASETGAKTAMGGGVAYAQYENLASTRIGAGVDLTAGGDLSVTADALIPSPVTLADDFRKPFEDAKEKFDKSNKDANEAYEKGAISKADLDKKLSDNRIDYQTDLATAGSTVASFAVSAPANRFWGLAGFEAGLLTSYVNSSAGGEYVSDNPDTEFTVLDSAGKAVLDKSGNPKTEQSVRQSADRSISASINILNLANSATVDLGANTRTTADGSVKIASDASMVTVNLTGLTSLWDVVWSAIARTGKTDDRASTTGQDAGVGAAVGLRILGNTSKTTIADNAAIESRWGTVSVKAHTLDLHVNIHEMGTDGGNTAIAGAVSVDVVTVTTEAVIAATASITAGGDILVDANSEFTQVNAGIGGSESERTAVGASIGVSVVNSTTRAVIGDPDNTGPRPAEDQPFRVRADGEVMVHAKRNETVVQVALAGAKRADKVRGEAEPAPADTVASSVIAGTPSGNSSAQGAFASNVTSPTPGGAPTVDPGTQAADVSSKAGKDNGFSAAGAALVNVSTAVVKAMIAGASVYAGGTVSIKAEQDRDLIMVSGGASLDSASSRSKASLAGAFAINVANRTVHATIANSVVQAGGIDVLADHDDFLVAVAAGGSIAKNTGVSLAVSATVSVFTTDTKAEASGSLLHADGDIEITAQSKADLISIAAAVGIVVTGEAGVGASVGVTSGNQTVSAVLHDSTTESGNLLVKAHGDHDVVSVVVGAGIAVEGSGGAGQFSLHLLKSDVRAKIGAGSNVHARNNVAVLADDGAGITSATGGVALGKDGSVGISVASVNIYNRNVSALIDDGAVVAADAEGEEVIYDALPKGSVTARGVLVLADVSDTVVNVVVGAAISADSFGGQGSLLIDTNDTDVKAQIGTDNGTTLNRANVSSLGGDVTIAATYDLVDVGIAGSLAVGGAGAGVGVSATFIVHTRDVTASVGTRALITSGGSLVQHADMDAVVRTVMATGAAGMDGASFGGAITVAVFVDTVTAEIGANAQVFSFDDVVVEADHVFGLTAIDAAVSGSGTTAFGGSAAVIIQNATTKAQIGSGAYVFANDSIVVDAVGTADIQALSGGVAVSAGTSSVGLGAVILVRDDKVQSQVLDGASLVALAFGPEDGVQRTDHWGVGETVTGVAVLAQSRETLVGITAQGSLGAPVAISGSLPVVVVSETTWAKIGQDVAINGTPGFGQNDRQNLTVRAKDETVLVVGAGNVSLAGESGVGVGLSSAITSVTKNTEAAIAGNSATGAALIRMGGNVIVDAAAQDKLVSVVLGGAGGQNVAVSLNGIALYHESNSSAHIGDRADVLAQGSVALSADQSTNGDFVGLTGVGSGVASVNGLIAATVFKRTVKAFVGDEAQVAGLGKTAGLANLRTGQIVGTETTAAASPVKVTDNGTEAGNGGETTKAFDPLAENFELGLPEFDRPDGSDDFFRALDFSPQRDASGFRGVSITATNVDDITTFSATLTGGGAAVSGNGVVTVVMADTSAYVGRNSWINLPPGADAGQSVRIAAGSAFDHLGMFVGATVGGAAISPAAHVVVADLSTLAYVRAGAYVDARRHIQVMADAHEELLSLGLLLSAGGVAGIAPGLSVIDLTGETTASVSGQLRAGGNLVISALDDSRVDVLAISVAGSGNAAAGAAVSTVTIHKTTTAIISGTAVASAAAGGVDTVLIPDGSSADMTGRTSVAGVVVQAQSAEDVNVVVIGGTVGFISGAGSVSVQFIDSDTEAAIRDGAIVNDVANLATYFDRQGVSVGAFNRLDLSVVAGAVAVGAGVSGAAGVAVADVRNATLASVGGTVTARGKLAVAALSQEKVKGVLVAAGGGLSAGVGAAVGVFRLGTGDVAAPTFTISRDGDTGTVVSAYGKNKDGAPNDPVAESAGTGASAVTAQKGTIKSGATTTAGQPTNRDTIRNDVAGSLTHGGSVIVLNPSQDTSAAIAADADVTAGSVAIDARKSTDVDLVIGGLGGGALGASGGIGIIQMGGELKAGIGAHAHVAITRPDLVTGNVGIRSDRDTNVRLVAFAGSGGYVLAAAAGVSRITDSTSTISLIDDAAVISRANDVFVAADSLSVLKAEAVAISAAVGVSGSVAYADVVTDGSTVALVGEVDVGHPGGPTDVHDFRVTARSTLVVGSPEAVLPGNDGTTQAPKAMAIGGSGSVIVSGTGAVAHVTDNRTTAAIVRPASDIAIWGLFELSAISASNLDVIVKGGALGAIGVGVMEAKAIIGSTTIARVEGEAARSTRISAGRAIILSKSDSLSRADTDVVSLGLGAGGNSNATIEATPTSLAEVGERVEVKTLGGSISVVANSLIEADASTRAVGGGAIAVNVAKAIVLINSAPETTPVELTSARVQANATLNAGSFIDVAAIYGSDSLLRQGIFDAVTGISDAQLQAAGRRDGATTAETDGYNVSLLGGGVSNNSVIDLKPVINASVGEAAELRSNFGFIEIAGITSTKGKGTSYTLGVEVLGGGQTSESSVSVTSQTSVSIGSNAVLWALQDIYLNSRADHNWTGTAEGEGGSGLIKVAFAFAEARIKETNTITVGDSSSLTAGGRLDAYASTTGATTTLGRFEGGSLLNTSIVVNRFDPRGATFDGITTVLIGVDARLVARQISVKASLHDVVAKATATIAGGSLSIPVTARAIALINSSSMVNIMAGARIESVEDVSLAAFAIDNSSTGTINLSAAGFGDTSVRALGWLDLKTDIVAAQGAAITAGRSALGAPSVSVRSLEGGNQDKATINKTINPAGKYDAVEWPTITRSNKVTWNADLVLTAGLAPRLVVDSLGNIVVADGVTVNGGKKAGDNVGVFGFLVDDIAPKSDASVVFDTLEIDGSGGTVYLTGGLGSVVLENNSAQDMIIGNINVLRSSSAEEPVVVITSPDRNDLTFGISERLPETTVDIRSTATGDIVIAGTINNPNGRVSVTSSAGDILQKSVRGTVIGPWTPLIIAHDLSLVASAGSVGSPGIGLAADVVSRLGRYGSDAFTLSVDAAVDAVLDLGFRERRYGAGSFSFFTGWQFMAHVAAGRDVDITAHRTIQETYDRTSGQLRVVADQLVNNVMVHAFDRTYAGSYKGGLLGAGVPYVGVSETLASRAEVGTLLFVGETSDSGLGTAGVMAGRNIDLREADAPGSTGSLNVAIAGWVDAGQSGEIDVSVGGYVILTELTGNMNLASVVSRFGDVSLRATTGSILDTQRDDVTDVAGNQITLVADMGTIGAAATGEDIGSWLDVHASQGLTATANGNILLQQDIGDILVAQIRSAHGDVGLWASVGSILAVAGGGSPGVAGRNIDLWALSGTIAGASRPFEIDTADGGRLVALAGNGMDIAEKTGSLRVLSAISGDGDTVLRTTDTEAEGEDIILLTGGQTAYGLNLDHARIASQGQVRILSADDFTMAANSVILAGSAVTIEGDDGNADVGLGSTMLLAGMIGPLSGDYRDTSILVSGGDDNDRIILQRLTLGADTRINGGDGNDLVRVTRLQGMTEALHSDPPGTWSGYALTLDGQTGSDRYVIQTTAARSPDPVGSYTINVFDSGTDAGFDRLSVVGSEWSDSFLMRAVHDVPVGHTGELGMIAALHGSRAEVTSGSDSGLSRPGAVERINHDGSLEGSIQLEGRGGNDSFYFDDTVQRMEVSGGEGVDRFVIGQMFGSARDALAQLGSGDVFDTSLTTSGYLSRGNSQSLTLFGDDGNDVIHVYSNGATLKVFGGDGNDTITLRAFANPMMPNVTEYHLNHFVQIDAGAGLDTVRIIGTDRNDSFFMTSRTIRGAGLGVSILPGAEVRRIFGMSGDNTYYVQSTPEDTLTVLFAGGGTDRFRLIWTEPDPVLYATYDPANGHLVGQILLPESSGLNLDKRILGRVAWGQPEGASTYIFSAAVLPQETNSLFALSAASTFVVEPSPIATSLSNQAEGYESSVASRVAIPALARAVPSDKPATDNSRTTDMGGPGEGVGPEKEVVTAGGLWFGPGTAPVSVSTGRLAGDGPGQPGPSDHAPGTDVDLIGGRLCAAPSQPEPAFASATQAILPGYAASANPSALTSNRRSLLVFDEETGAMSSLARSPSTPMPVSASVSASFLAILKEMGEDWAVRA